MTRARIRKALSRRGSIWWPRPLATSKTSRCGRCACSRKPTRLLAKIRQTQKLLNHYGISSRTVRYHEHNELTRAPELVLDLEGGARVALVTDAGMPGISDPGFRLISLAIRHHIPVVPIPGASAFLAALVASGLPTDSFRFSGFFPPKSGQRRQMLEGVKASPRTQVFYEAPHRVKEAVEDVVEI